MVAQVAFFVCPHRLSVAGQNRIAHRVGSHTGRTPHFCGRSPCERPETTITAKSHRPQGAPTGKPRPAPGGRPPCGRSAIHRYRGSQPHRLPSRIIAYLSHHPSPSRVADNITRHHPTFFSLSH